MKTSVSLVIPAYNEEARIGKTLADAHSYLSRNYPQFEIIVVDDGSIDATFDIASDFGHNFDNVRTIKNGTNRGKGYSVRTAALGSSGDIVAFSDADGSVPISELRRFIDLIEKGADVVIGSRALKNSSIIKRQTLWRQTMGRIFNLFVRMSVLKGIGDTQCGFKCFKRSVALDLFSKQKVDRFAFDVELLYLAFLNGYKVRQIPVRWINSTRSTVDPLRDSANMLKDLLSIKKLHRKAR